MAELELNIFTSVGTRDNSQPCIDKYYNTFINAAVEDGDGDATLQITDDVSRCQRDSNGYDKSNGISANLITDNVVETATMFLQGENCITTHPTITGEENLSATAGVGTQSSSDGDASSINNSQNGGRWTQDEHIKFLGNLILTIFVMARFPFIHTRTPQ